MANHNPKHAPHTIHHQDDLAVASACSISERAAGVTTLRGFTLIELLVVIFIISIVTSVALLSVSRNDNKRLESFTNELVQTVTLAEEQAMLQPTVLGLSVGQDSFQFSTYHAVVDKKINPWTPIKDRLLGKRAIPDGIEVSVMVGGKRSGSTDETDEDKSDSDDEAAAIKVPQIIISTNGDITPFTIYIGKRGKQPRYVINGDADGNITSRSLS